MRIRTLGAVVALLSLALARQTWASNGEKPTTFGAIAGGRGGVDYAYAEDGTAPTTNPGGLGFVNDRLDWTSAYLLSLGDVATQSGREGLSPAWTTAPLDQLGVVVDPTAPIHLGDLVEDKWGLTPERKADDYGGIFHLGIGVYTTAGSSFTFNHIETPFFSPAAEKYRADEATIRMGPTFAFRIMDLISIGYSPSFRYSQLALDSSIEQPNTGLTQSFRAVIPSVTTYAQSHNLESYGFTQRFGAKLKTEYFSAGLVYQDRSYSDDYKGQVVQQAGAGLLKLPTVAQAALVQVLNPSLGYGAKYDARVERFESPREFGAGIKVSPIDRFSFGVDYTYIMWSEFRRTLQVRLTNPNNRNFTILTGNTVEIHDPLEWNDQSVVALGAEGAVLQGDDIVPGFPSYKLILRAGYNWAQSPLPKNTLNPALPLLLEHHASLGVTLAVGPYLEISSSAIHGFNVSDRVGVDHANSDLSFSHVSMQDWAVLTQLSIKF